jgi:hypothetical protein
MHRVPNQRVGAGRNDFLVRNQFDVCRAKSIFPENEKNREPAERYKRIACQGYMRRDVRPSEAMIQCGMTRRPINPSDVKGTMIF